MQHLDEGTIHSWLDGALSVDEAARVEAHVAECPQCAAAVAEARGFIAASSRILTALDNAPRGVIPAAAPVKRVNPLVWRVAATVLVVAAGSLVVVQSRVSKEPLRATSENQTAKSPEAASVTGRDEAVQAAGTAQTATARVADGDLPNAMVSKAPTNRASAIDLSKGAGRSRLPRDITTGDKTALAQSAPMRGGQTAATSDFARVPPPGAPLAPPRAATVAALDATAEPERLKVVGNPRQIGAKITLYEVAPGDTVTLTEPMAVDLSSVVVTSAAAGARMAPQATGKNMAPPATARADAATTTAAPESRRTSELAAAAPAVSAAAPTAQTGAAIALHTIRWIDSATGNTLTLSGRMPEARLQEIRIRIERERAAAAKKIP